MNDTTIFATRSLEFIAAVQFIVSTGMVLFLWWFIARTMKWRKPTSWWALWSSPSLKIGWALMIYSLGEAINRGLVWYTRHVEVNAGWIAWNDNFTFWATVSAIINTWGGLCVLRIASPDSAGEGPWLFVLIAAISFGIVTSYGPLVMDLLFSL